jgi:xylulokinase
MANGHYAVTVDLGTTGLKVGFVSFGGDLVWSDHAPCVTRTLPGGGREQDAEGWWQTIAAMIRAGVASGDFDPGQVAVIACTGQWASTVPVDADGVAVGPCIMWNDTRGRRHARERVGGRLAGYSPIALRRWVRRTAAAPFADGKGPLGGQLYLLRERPEIARAARWFLEPVDYLTMRFTGVAAATHPSMRASWLTDNRHPDVLGYDADLVRWAGIDAGKLPPITRTSSVAGNIRDDVADGLGLPRRTPAVTGLPDLDTAPAGSGALGDDAHLVVGTTSWISCAAPGKKSDLAHEVISVPGPIHGRYVVVDNIDTAGACLDWFRRIVSLDGTAAAPDVDAGALIDLAVTVPPGSDGVVFTPWLSGAQAPIADASARAGFHNVRLHTGAAEMARAVLEGVAVQNALLLGAVERFVRRRLEPLRIIGGGARSDVWCQIHADALDRTLERPVDPINAGLRGAALNAAMAIGAITADDIHRCVKIDATFHPDPANRPLYERMARTMRKLHRGQKRPLAHLNRRRAHQPVDD